MTWQWWALMVFFSLNTVADVYREARDGEPVRAVFGLALNTGLLTCVWGLR